MLTIFYFFFSEIRNIDQAFASEKIEKLSQITPFSVQKLTNFFDFFKKANEDPVGRLVVNRSQFSSAMLKVGKEGKEGREGREGREGKREGENDEKDEKDFF